MEQRILPFDLHETVKLWFLDVLPNGIMFTTLIGRYRAYYTDHPLTFNLLISFSYNEIPSDSFSALL